MKPDQASLVLTASDKLTGGGGGGLTRAIRNECVDESGFEEQPIKEEVLLSRALRAVGEGGGRRSAAAAVRRGIRPDLYGGDHRRLVPIALQGLEPRGGRGQATSSGHVDQRATGDTQRESGGDELTKANAQRGGGSVRCRRTCP